MEGLPCNFLSLFSPFFSTKPLLRLVEMEVLLAGGCMRHLLSPHIWFPQLRSTAWLIVENCDVILCYEALVPDHPNFFEITLISKACLTLI